MPKPPKAKSTFMTRIRGISCLRPLMGAPWKSSWPKVVVMVRVVSSSSKYLCRSWFEPVSSSDVIYACFAVPPFLFCRRGSVTPGWPRWVIPFPCSCLLNPLPCPVSFTLFALCVFFFKFRVHFFFDHIQHSFRDEEVNWEYVRVLPDGECVSVDGTHLGHNLRKCRSNGLVSWVLLSHTYIPRETKLQVQYHPHSSGCLWYTSCIFVCLFSCFFVYYLVADKRNRYCINLVSVAGQPAASS